MTPIGVGSSTEGTLNLFLRYVAAEPAVLHIAIVPSEFAESVISDSCVPPSGRGGLYPQAILENPAFMIYLKGICFAHSLNAAYSLSPYVTRIDYPSDNIYFVIWLTLNCKSFNKCPQGIIIACNMCANITWCGCRKYPHFIIYRCLFCY